MLWIQVINAASQVSAIIADIVAKYSSQEKQRLKAEKVREFSRLVSEITFAAIRFASNVHNKRYKQPPSSSRESKHDLLSEPYNKRPTPVRSHKHVEDKPQS